MMKRILLIIAVLCISMQIYPMTEEPEKVIPLKGQYKLLPHSVQVTLDKDKTLTTTSNKDMDNLTITIKKQSGEIVSVETVDAKEWNSNSTYIPNYKEGEYIIEISTPDGELEGKF